MSYSRFQAMRLLEVLKEFDAFVTRRLADLDDPIRLPILGRLIGVENPLHPIVLSISARFAPVYPWAASVKEMSCVR